MTSGFYKLDLIGGQLIFAPNAVHAPSFVLDRNDENSKTGSHDGWQWFNSDIEAYTFHGITPASQPWAISPMQAKIVLYRRGLLNEVLALVSASGIEAQLAWDNAPAFNRNSPLLNMILDNLTSPPASEERDAMFLEAATIVV